MPCTVLSHVAYNSLLALVLHRLTNKALAHTHRQRGSLDVLGQVDDLSQARHTQGDVLCRHTGKVEGVQSHLGGGLSYTLSCYSADSFACIG